MIGASESLPRPVDLLLEPSFDPQAHIIHYAKRHGNIAAVPDNLAADTLLRWYPSNAMQALYGQQEVSPQEILQTAIYVPHTGYQRQLERVASLGIPVVENRYQLIRHPSIPHSEIWLATVRRIAGRELMIDDPQGHHIPPILMDYYTTNDQVLTDIHRPDQYMIEPALGNAQERVVLTDIEPRLLCGVAMTLNAELNEWYLTAQQAQGRDLQSI
jgi:hypothetical protein